MITTALALHRHILDAHSRDGELLGREPWRTWRTTVWAGSSRATSAPFPGAISSTTSRGRRTGCSRTGGCRRCSTSRGTPRSRPSAPSVCWRASERTAPGSTPNREWKGRIATAEGGWASIGLLDTHRHTGDRRFLEGALRWNEYVDEHVGYESVTGNLAVNYFAGRPGSAVPNNSAFTVRLLAELAGAAADETYLRRCPSLLGFLGASQMPNGELP